MNVTIVADMLNGFCRRGNLYSPRCEAVIPAVADVLTQNDSDQIIFLADNHVPDDKEFDMFPEHCLQGSNETEIVDELKPFVSGAFVIRKRRYSGFFETNLDIILRGIQPEQVTVVGVCTDICVLHTVADLRNRDYRVVVRQEATATFDSPGRHNGDEAQRFALDHMVGVLGAEVPAEVSALK